MPPKSIPRGLEHAAAFRRRLLAWFRRRGRDLPWRRTRDPYRVLVSEVMLQQTPVSRVEAYYPAFLARFPDLAALAASPASAVREAWDGLGYYRRATNLHRLARDVVSGHGGRMPSDVTTLRRLPGVGRYTAGAVASFAFERVEPCVDTNVGRVIRRVFHPRLAGRPGADRRVWATAAALLPRDGKRAWLFNQAVMELGAMVCRARAPRCGECPVNRECRTGRSQGKTGNREQGTGNRERR
ncbi:MAG: A/G-specific adenine glycosylase [Gemmatimonadales bacterium]